ncbi:MAG: acyl-CoA dehydratase activase-related protein [Oscillospiraceae bacterium]|nr:acyl-CoA dehydratase activase-related protein [Oscillospiraceae bacterium]
MNIKIGLDIGSTTLKCVVLDEKENILYKTYGRHFSLVREKTAELLEDIKRQFPEASADLCISGSAGMGLADSCGISFAQEVYATNVAVKRLVPHADVVIELGGEDAKILFLTHGLEVRMNGSCAGGTGAFIDQMATLLGVSAAEMDQLAQKHEKIYTVASRCGVFAKSDIQPLLNQGARKEDICAGIFYAVVNQTIAGLAQGREIAGNVLYLGGPLSFLPRLRDAFDDVLGAVGIFPENSLYFVALGAAYIGGKSVSIDQILQKILSYNAEGEFSKSSALFSGMDEYNDFKARHGGASVPYRSLTEPSGWIGIDAGSTTVKMVLIGKDGSIAESRYLSNSGNPVSAVRDFLSFIYEKYPDIVIKGSCATGYGEEIIKNAFRIDHGVVETIAHFTAAKRFMPDVDFILDIGGQDIKCFKIKNGVIDNIFLNEACSSGCGSFLQTFAGALEKDIGEFAQLGLFAKNPVDLGSRCTVFMNSSIKQAQKDGAGLDDISAGLSVSVVKNALYKVIRAASPQILGNNIVVQGGTFLNDAVLRAFEQEIKHEVVRPEIAGLMGAYGAALYAQSQTEGKSRIISPQELAEFTHNVSAVTCKQCGNHCKLTVNTFASGERFIGGNRCEKPGGKVTSGELNIYEYKHRLLDAYRNKTAAKNPRGRIGIPMGLNMYEMLPFWSAFFGTLGFDIVTSPPSNRKLYLKGQHTIPSDTVCFPAKLIHGHIEALAQEEIDAIFYPCMTYNYDEGMGDNHYNCPVVAYYPEVIKANAGALNDIPLIHDYIGIHRKKDFTVKIGEILGKYFDRISIGEVRAAVENAYNEQEKYLSLLKEQGHEIMRIARERGLQTVILAGRPYHIDNEVCHGIDKLICQFGAAVVSEDSIEFEGGKTDVSVLNQWTYHSRLYAAAEYAAKRDGIDLIQLVSFGCGVDAVTTDEVRAILERNGKIYTQIKIDEITNLGAVNIRLRSLFAAKPR